MSVRVEPVTLTEAPTSLGARCACAELFSFKDEPNLAESPKLKKHAMSVMNTVDVAVKGLADLSKLVPVLQARQHTCRMPRTGAACAAV